MGKKPPKPQVAESPIADVFENRHRTRCRFPQWAEKTLGPTLEKIPEHPIGAPSGVNLDEHGHARFTTISGVPVRRLYTQADLPRGLERRKTSRISRPTLTRGIHATGYHHKLYTIRRFYGFRARGNQPALQIY